MKEPVPGRGVEYWRAQQLAAALHDAAAKGSGGRSEGRSGERGDLPNRVCAAAVGALGAQGSTLCAVFAPGMSVPVGVSDPVAARAEELQFSAGEGPCWQAHATGEVVVAELQGTGGAHQRWPAYTLALQREVGYAAVVAVPLRLALGLALGLDLVFTVYGPWSVTERWWQHAPVVVGALQEVLEEASSPAAGGPVWLDSATTLRRGAVWVAEAVLVQQDPSLDAAGALRALRTFAVVEGMTVDAAAAALVQGGLSARRVLGR